MGSVNEVYMPSKTKGQRESVLEVCKLCKYESKCICRVSVGWEHPLELVAAFGVGSLSSMNSHFPSTLDNIFANHHLVTSHPSEPSPVGHHSHRREWSVAALRILTESWVRLRLGLGLGPSCKCVWVVIHHPSLCGVSSAYPLPSELPS